MLLTLTPNSAGAGSLTLVGDPGGIAVMGGELDLPTPLYEDFYAESADGEGSPLIGFRDVNPTGTIPLRIRGDNATDFWANVTALQKTIAEVRRISKRLRTYGAALAWTPTDGATVTYQVVSMRIVSMPQHRDYGTQQALAEVEFTCLPYGLLGDVTLVTAATGSEPLLSFELPNVPGHVDAWLSLLATDTATQERWHVEYGIEETYDPASPTDLLLTKDPADLNATGLSGTSATRAGSYGATVYQATVTPTPVAICSTGARPHAGLRRVKTRVYANTAETYVQLHWRIGDGPWNRNPWKPCLTGAWTEADLELIDVPSGETWEGRIVGKCATSGLLQVDYVIPFPADRYGKAKGLVGDPPVEDSPAVYSGQSIRFRHNVVQRENAAGDRWGRAPQFDGEYATCPPAGPDNRTFRGAVKLRRLDVDTQADANVTDSCRVDVSATPRVLLVSN